MLVRILSVGIVIRLTRKNLFMIWFGLELNMFGVIPLILLNSTEEKKRELNAGLYYFIIQVLGRMMFSWGSIIGRRSLVGVLGLIIKMGVSPFFWWVPAVIRRLDWFRILILSTVQKLPVLLLIRVRFDLKFFSALFLCLSGLLIRIVGIYFSTKKFKSLLAWSSVGNIRLILLLLVIYLKLGFIYFICYSIRVARICIYILNVEIKDIVQNKNRSNKVKNLIIASLFVLVFSGIPPLLGFVGKVLLFRGISIREMDLLIKQVEVIWKNKFMVEYPLFCVLGTWKLSIVIALILIIQIVAYVKVFIKLYISNSINLEARSRLRVKRNKISRVVIIIVLLRILPLFLL